MGQCSKTGFSPIRIITINSRTWSLIPPIPAKDPWRPRRRPAAPNAQTQEVRANCCLHRQFTLPKDKCFDVSPNGKDESKILHGKFIHFRFPRSISPSNVVTLHRTCASEILNSYLQFASILSCPELVLASSLTHLRQSFTKHILSIPKLKAYVWNKGVVYY